VKELLEVQNVRLLDVFVIAPFLFYVGTREKNNYIKAGIYLIAAGTLLYNGYNYIKTKK
jgi:hypothetical protein